LYGAVSAESAMKIQEATEPVLLHPSQTRHSHLLPIFHFGPAATLNWNSGERGKKKEKKRAVT